MSEGIPLSEKEITDHILKFDRAIQEDYNLFQAIMNEEKMTDENGNELSEEKTKEMKEKLEEALGIEYYENIAIINVLGLVVSDESDFFIYKGTDSRGVIEFRDANGDTGYLTHDRKIFDPIADAKYNKELR
ncbi:hypothetical protein A2Z22_00760 [Candidatus Woesebacteria bacterium RBG_16_34_12]|uniref:Uncharacterized protein n=1 Tax=Candidatus Woesebacteria bacterium RBG_16_34_12 TaxID=1802480 RepID=A0A1F7X6M3_9BACT|nr:MAG: hypothetical protein A2Z22_00760 [Candidatus Woesebacteria bacterium RBG_16_34_12]